MFQRILLILFGTLLGVLLGIFIWFLQHICNFDNEISFHILLVYGIIGAIFSYIVDLKIRVKQKVTVAQRIKQGETMYKKWCSNLLGMYNSVIDKAWSMDTTFNPAYDYEQILKQLKIQVNETDDRYIETYEKYRDNHIKCLKNNLLNLLVCSSKLDEKTKDLTSLIRASNMLRCLNCVEDNDTNKKALEVLNQVVAMKKEGLNEFYTYVSQLNNSDNNLIEIIADDGLLDFIKSAVKSNDLNAERTINTSNT